MSNVEYDFDTMMQKKILALLIQDYQYLSTVGIEVVVPSYFDNIVYQNICKWITVYFKQYHTQITESVLINELNKYDDVVRMTVDEKQMYLSTIKDMIGLQIEDADYIKDCATEFARKSAFREAILKAKDLYDQDGDYESVMQVFQNALSTGSGDNLGLNLTDVIDKMPEMLNEVYDRRNLFKTNIESLDNALLGGMARGELHVFCFTGDTKVKTDKGNIEFKDLINNFKDKTIYSVDNNGNRIETKIDNVFISGYENRLQKITLPSGSIIKCTPEHKFLLKDGTYKMAKDLTCDDDLMEFNNEL